MHLPGALTLRASQERPFLKKLGMSHALLQNSNASRPALLSMIDLFSLKTKSHGEVVV
jgi:hypothetical protein